MPWHDRLRMHEHVDLIGAEGLNRYEASMTSRPLFIIDAESIVIFWPMLQFGCFQRLPPSVACPRYRRRPRLRNGSAGRGDDHPHQLFAIAGLTSA